MNSIWIRKEDLKRRGFFKNFEKNQKLLDDMYGINNYIFQIMDKKDLDLFGKAILNCNHNHSICIDTRVFDTEDSFNLLTNKLGYGFCFNDYVILDYIRSDKRIKGFWNALKNNLSMYKKVYKYQKYFIDDKIACVVKRPEALLEYGQLLFTLTQKPALVMPMLYSQCYGKDQEWVGDSIEWFRGKKLEFTPIIQAYYDKNENPAGQKPVNLCRVVAEYAAYICDYSLYRYTTFLKMM